MAYELVAGRPPFQDASSHRVLAAHIGQTPASLPDLRPDVPSSLAALVMQCLAKDAVDRPQSAGELTRVLDAVTSGGSFAAMPAATPATTLRRALVTWAVAFVGVGLLAQMAKVAIGLPDWVLPGALLVMAAGLPVVLLTGWVHRETQRVQQATPTRTPGGSPRPHGTLATMAVRASPLVSWRRATLGGVAAVATFVVAVTVYMVLRALGIGPFGSLIAAGKIDSRDPLLVADFQTSVEDSALSRVLAEAVRTNLSESRVVSLVSPGAVAAGLQRMRVPIDTTLSAELARGLAQREGIKAIVAGSVSALSSGYAISARLVAVESGEPLVSVQETVDGASDLIAATDRLSRKLRERIGESLKDVRAGAPLAQVTTSSLEALKKYAEGVRANDVEGDFAKAVRLLEEAIALDSNFGMAYRKLGVSLGNRGDFSVPEHRRLYEEAYRLRDRMTERERLLATAGYFASGPSPDRAKAIEAYEAVIARFPDDGPSLQNLAQLYEGRREFARAESLFLRRMELDSSVQFAPFNVIPVQINLGKLDAARASAARAARLFPNHSRIHASDGILHYAEARIDSAMRAFMEGRSSRRGFQGFYDEAVAALHLVQGRLTDASRVVLEARAADRARTRTDELEDSLNSAALALWLFDRPEEMLERVDAALRLIPLESLPPGSRPYPRLIQVYAAAGQAGRARTLLSRWDAEVTDTVARRLGEWNRQLARARIATAEQRHREAIDLFRASDTRPDGPRQPCAICMDPEVGLAFDRAEMHDSTIAVYEHYVTTPDAYRVFADAADLARILRRLGELHEARGNRAQAATYYQRFVDLWKDADPALQPRVAEIRQRLARLRDVEGR
jgi:tetratricopeptide (TPR) repeat protein